MSNDASENSITLAGFEQQLKELEAIVAAMEAGDMTLEQSLQAYEKGVELTRQCQAALTTAHQRMEMLIERDGETQIAPMQPEQS